MRTLVWLLLLQAGCEKSVGQLAAPPDLAGAAPPAVIAPMVGLYLADDQSTLEAGRYAESFNFYDLRALWVRAVVSKLPGRTTLHLVFIDPQGTAFYEDHVPFTQEPTGGTMMNPTMGTPQMMLVARPIGEAHALDRAIPISGTSFVRFPREGDWQVQATIDGVPGTLTALMRVVIAR